MAEPDNIVLEHLRGIRAQIEQLDRKFDAKLDGLTERVDTLEIKLDGLTHAVIAGSARSFMNSTL